MPFVDYNKSGIKTQYKATAWTCVIYEQEFGRDLIKDIDGKIDITHVDSAGVLDFTQTNGLGQIIAGGGLTKTGNQLDIGTVEYARAPRELALNDIGRVRVRLADDLPIDDYRELRRTGAFLLIDEADGATLAAGMAETADRYAGASI